MAQNKKRRRKKKTEASKTERKAEGKINHNVHIYFKSYKTIINICNVHPYNEITSPKEFSAIKPEMGIL